jgi:hypothetical protein
MIVASPARTLTAAALAALLLTFLLPAAADAWPSHYRAVARNPANAGRIFQLPLEPSVYDPATRCSKRPRPGTVALVAWLEASFAGDSWGTYRCEKWGRRSASLHAEGRAVDWHLDAADRSDRREADRLIALLLAPDKAGNPHALARRMGVEEIIWDCGYWGAGMESHRRYSACLTRTGKISRKVDKTTAHRDHVHIGLTLAGATKRTSFWRAQAAR